MTPQEALDELHCVAMGMKKPDDDTWQAEEILLSVIVENRNYKSKLDTCKELSWKVQNAKKELDKYDEILSKYDVHSIKDLDVWLGITKKMEGYLKALKLISKYVGKEQVLFFMRQANCSCAEFELVEKVL